jgi:hypothetical protein
MDWKAEEPRRLINCSLPKSRIVRGAAKPDVLLVDSADQAFCIEMVLDFRQETGSLSNLRDQPGRGYGELGATRLITKAAVERGIAGIECNPPSLPSRERC